MIDRQDVDTLAAALVYTWGTEAVAQEIADMMRENADENYRYVYLARMLLDFAEGHRNG